MKMIMRFLKDYKKECVLAPLFKMLEAIFELFVPLVVSSVIDKGIVNADKGYIMQMCLMLILLAIIGLVCAITAQYFSAKAAVGAATGMRHSLFAHIQTFSFTEMDTLGTSTLVIPRILSSPDCTFLYIGLVASMIPNTISASTGIAATNTSAAFTSIVNAIIIAPNTINGERRNSRSTMLIPFCT